MGREQESDAAERIIAVVLESVETDGYDGVQLRAIAGRARVSLAKIYRLFPTRDELILAALEQWMSEHAYAQVAPPAPEESVRDAMMRVLRCVFEPWERHPRLLEAYHHARSGPHGHRLDSQGLSAVLPVAEIVMRDLDPGYVEDVAIIMTNMTVALIGRFATGTVEITEILPILERTVHRLTADNETPAKTRVRADSPPPEGLTASFVVASDHLRQMSGAESAR